MILDNEDSIIKKCVEYSKNPFKLLSSFVNECPMDHAEELLRILNMIKLPNGRKFSKKYNIREEYVNAHIGRSYNYIMGIRFVNPFRAVENIHGDKLLIGFKPDPEFLSREDVFKIIKQYDLHICKFNSYDLIVCSV